MTRPNSSSGSSSSPSSIPPTSPISSTPSSTPTQHTLESTQAVLIVQRSAPKRFQVADWLPALPTIIVGLISLLIVDRLTRGREREKTALELYKSVGDQLKEVAGAASTGWTHRRGPERSRAIAETKWRLQRLGATVQRLRLLTAKRRWRWTTWYWKRVDASVEMVAEMTALRRSLTRDPFEDPARLALPNEKAVIEGSIGVFQSALDEKLYEWSR